MPSAGAIGVNDPVLLRSPDTLSGWTQLGSDGSPKGRLRGMGHLVGSAMLARFQGSIAARIGMRPSSSRNGLQLTLFGPEERSVIWRCFTTPPISNST